MSYRAVDHYVHERVRHFLRHRHKVASRCAISFSNAIVFGKLGVLRLRDVHLGASPCVATFFSYTNGSPKLLARSATTGSAAMIAGRAARLSSGSRGGPFRGAPLAPFARWLSGAGVKIQTHFRFR
jgi:hypothetical protein